MTSFTQDLIARQKNSLHRAPPPKAPQGKPKNIVQGNDNDSQTSPFPFKLKKTGFRDSLIAEDFTNKDFEHSVDSQSEVQSVIAKRKALFETKELDNCKHEVKPNKPPKPKPKPAPRLSEEKENANKSRSDSCNSDVREDTETDANENVVFVDDSKAGTSLRPLPTLHSLGKPPPKAPKPGNLKNVLDRFSKEDIVMAPRRNTLRSDAEEREQDLDADEGEDFYDDVAEDLKSKILGKGEGEQERTPSVQEDSGIMEECYDDVEDVVGKVNEMNAKEEPICEESYDDLDTIAEQVQQMNNGSNEGDEFGEELYEPLMDNEEVAGSESPVRREPPVVPIASIPHKVEDQKKGGKKDKKEIEMQKRKEKEEQKKTKEEQKRKEKKEKEEKQKREREDKELRKKHKLKPGCEGSGFGISKADFPGDGKCELPAKEGETLFVLSEESCPAGKWLVKNTEGHLGYVPTELVKLEVDSHGNRISMLITEELYEDVDQYQGGGVGVPDTPPAVPGGARGSIPAVEQIEEEAEDEDFYDDIGGQEPIDEDLYEELPADQ